MTAQMTTRETIARTIGERISALRQSCDLTIDEVAELCGTSKSHVWELEKGRGRNPTIYMVAALARTFGVSLDYLVGFSTETTNIDPDALRIACEIDALLRRAALTKEPKP